MVSLALSTSNLSLSPPRSKETVALTPPRQEENNSRDVSIDVAVVDTELPSTPVQDNHSIGGSPRDGEVFQVQDDGTDLSPSPSPFSPIPRDSTPTTSSFNPAILPFNLTRTPDKGPLVTLSLLQLTGMFLLARQRGRETEFKQNWTIRPDETQNRYIALFDGQIVQGLRFILWHQNEEPDHRTTKGMRACAFGCLRSGIRPWASSQRYTTRLLFNEDNL
jgi:hypothetical protein